METSVHKFDARGSLSDNARPCSSTVVSVAKFEIFYFYEKKSVDDKKSKYLYFHSKNESFGNRDVIFKPSNWLFPDY
jgi:hypothetical protein